MKIFSMLRIYVFLWISINITFVFSEEKLIYDKSIQTNSTFDICSSLSVGMQSPTAASLGKFGDIPVSLYTGIPDISIPIYEVRGRNLSLPISLKYHASGIHVEEIAGWVGLGWALNAGGVITRTVRGIPDDKPGGYYYTGNELNNDSNFSNLSDFDYISKLKHDISDSKPDIFYFNFASWTGKFYLTPDGVFTVPYEKITFNFQLNYDKGIEKWIVITEDGTKYIFEEREITTAIVQQYPLQSHNYTSSWYLTKIESPNGIDVIILNYENKGTAVHKYQTYREESLIIYTDSNNPSTIEPIIMDTKYYTTNIYLKSIVSACDSVIFNISLRQDALSAEDEVTPQEYKLDDIEIKDSNGSYLKKYLFEYDYYNNNGSGYDMKRLRLKHLHEEAGNESKKVPPYRFEYSYVNLPSRFSTGIDYWGYYNGKDSNVDLIPRLYLKESHSIYYPSPVHLWGADRRADTDYTCAGILTKIIYPTGGYTGFIYENNDYGFVGANEVEDELVYSEWQYKVVSADNGQNDEVAFQVSGTEEVKVKLNVTAENPNPAGFTAAWVKIINSSDSTVAHVGQTSTSYFMLKPGNYVLKAYGGSEQGTKIDEAVLSWQNISLVNKKTKTAGGVRIKKIMIHDGIDSSHDIIKKYVYAMITDSERSSGSLATKPVNHFWGQVSDPPHNVLYTEFLTRSSMSFNPLGMTQGSPIGYEYVRIIYGETGEYGEELHHFKSPRSDPDEKLDDASWPLKERLWPYGERISRDWKRGMPVDEKYFSSSGVLLKQIKYNYHVDLSNQTTKDIRGLSFKNHNVRSSFPEEFDPTYIRTIWYENICPLINRYLIESRWIYLKSKTIFEYDANGNAASTITEYFYDKPSHMQLTKMIETNSDGKKRITEYEYAHEHYSDMKTSEHKISQIYSITLKDQSDILLAKKLKEWSNITGRWLPKAEWKWKNSTDSIKIASYTAWDPYGRLLEIRDGNENINKLYYGNNFKPFENNNGLFLTGIQKVIGSPDTPPATSGIRPGNDLFTEYHYNDSGQINKIIDENGISVSYTYDELHRLNSIINDDNNILNKYEYYYSLDNHSGYEPSAPNYIKTSTYTGESSIIKKVYFNGLGMDIQTHLHDGTDDIITAKEYDTRGREYKVWKPYKQNTNHSYDMSFESNGKNYYDGTPEANCGNYPFKEISFYEDPLDRIKKIGNPGYVFRQGSGHEINQSYSLNSTAITIGPNYSFAANTLTKTVTTNEDGQITEVYADLFGNKVFEVIDPNGLNLRTGFKYDLQRNLLKVFHPNYYNPPAGSTPDQWITSYTYNTLGQLVSRESPDAGTVRYKYDTMGNLRFVQDARHDAGGDDLIFYKYDDQNRLIIIGEAKSDATIPSWSELDGSVSYTSGTENFEAISDNYKVVYAYDAEPAYGTGVWASAIDPGILKYLKGRQSGVAYRDEVSGDWGYVFYSYDKHGNTAELYQDLPGSDVGVKVFNYTYDWQNRITKVAYQPGQADQFYVWYEYNNTGQIYRVKSHTVDNKAAAHDNVLYSYNAAGLVKRMVLGETAQGMDYLYNPRDWLLQINHQNLNTEQAPGVAGDKFGLVMNYESIGHIGNAQGAQPSYSGNVSWMMWQIQGVSVPYSLIGYTFDYDKANRLTQSDYGHYSSGWQLNSAGDVKNISYDGNGNIIALQRHNLFNGGQIMDNLTFLYQSGTNRLDHVDDAVSASVAEHDMDDQSEGNYTYDASGNVTSDTSKKLLDIKYDFRNLAYRLNYGGSVIINTSYNSTENIKSGWNIETCGIVNLSGSSDVTFSSGNAVNLKPGFYAKAGCTFHALIDPSLQNTSPAQLKMTYDQNGRRVLRANADGSRTSYVRDASGNVFSVYGKDGNVDQYFIYGNDLIGEFKPDGTGYRYYLKDHLGSVRVVVDRSGAVKDYYDYYPFGQIQRSKGFCNGVRFKYTGKELDAHTGHYYFGARYYDAGVGRWLSVDQYAEMYPFLSPYHYCGNNPLLFVDVNGDSIRVSETMLNDKALANYASTVEGNKYLSQFAYNGQTITINGKTFTYNKSGKYSMQNLVFAGIRNDAETTVHNSIGGKNFISREGVQTYNIYRSNASQMGARMDDIFHEVQHAFMFASGGFSGNYKQSNIVDRHHGAMMQGKLWRSHARFIQQVNSGGFNARINPDFIWINTLWNQIVDPKVVNAVSCGTKVGY